MLFRSIMTGAEFSPNACVITLNSTLSILGNWLLKAVVIASYYQICDLEEEVKEMLGESFDHNEFVTELLSVGGASFDITRSYIMEWANEKLHG